METIKWPQWSFGGFFVCWKGGVVPGQGVISLPWALSLVKCVAVWMPMLTHIQASHTDVLKTHETQNFPTKLLESKKTSNEYLAHFLWLKFGNNTSGTTLLLDSCLEGCIFTSLFGFVWENYTTHATLCINFLLFGCFRLNFLKIYATIFGIYEG